MSFTAGDAVLLRSIYRGNVRWCFPHHYVGEWEGRLGIYCGPGNRGKVMRRAPGGRYLERWVTDAPPDSYTWDTSHVLRFMRPGDSHTVEVFWDENWGLIGWYVNLQAPLVVHGGRFDTTDWALDVVIAPDGAWRWKDEEELAESVALGVFENDEAAARVREEGERVIAEQPWPTGWEDWRPPATWDPLPLPDDWHVVETAAPL